MPEDANIIGAFLSAAGSYPQHTALAHNNAAITYGSLLNAVQRTAGGMHDRGIRKGDTVLVAVPMSMELYTVVLALFYIGAVPVFLDAWVGRKRLAECLVNVPCKALIAPRKILLLSYLFRALRRIAVKSTPAALLQGKQVMRPEPVAPDNTALITFTTGSAGPPKAANRTHRFLHAQLAALRPLLPQGQETSLTTLPIVVLLHLAMGKTTVLPPSKYQMKQPRSIRHLRSALQAHQVETLVVSPSVTALLVQGDDLPHIRRIITGGGPVFPDLARRMTARFPQAEITVVFGSTEAEPISHLEAATVAAANEDMMRQSGLPVGLPDAAATIGIIPWKAGPIAPKNATAWSALQLSPGEWGEIVVAGAHVLEHYINNPGAEGLNKILVDGITWHRTGDAGQMDGEARLYLLGRCTEAIDCRGRAIFPVIIAWQITERTGIRGAALLEVSGLIITVLEAADKTAEPVAGAVLQEYGIDNPVVRHIKRLPRDPRHLTKIDYAALRRMLCS